MHLSVIVYLPVPECYTFAVAAAVAVDFKTLCKTAIVSRAIGKQEEHITLAWQIDTRSKYNTPSASERINE